MLRDHRTGTVEQFNRESAQRAWRLQIDRVTIPSHGEGWRLFDSVSNKMIAWSPDSEMILLLANSRAKPRDMKD